MFRQKYSGLLLFGCCVGSLWAGIGKDCAAVQPVVPGTGQKADKVGDDFEDEKWSYNFNNPKSSHEQDDQIRYPAGGSTNGRWSESAKRGHPDVIERVPTPPGGLEGSKGALHLKTLYSGIPNRISGQNQQDDLIVNVSGRLNGYLPASACPNIVVRVFLPPFDEWEQRTGNSFGMRMSIDGYRPNDGKRDTYWPGIFLHLSCKSDSRIKESYAQILMRGGPSGHDFWGPKITETGWWTLGMSITPEGAVQFYAHAGIDDLRAEDMISSQFPYGFQAQRLQTFFFDVVNRDDGRSWSTDWIIDDPSLYYQRERGRVPAADAELHRPA